MTILLAKDTPQNDHLFSSDSSANNNPSTSEKHIDSENENIQLQTIPEKNPSLIKQSKTILFLYPSFFERTSKFKEYVLLPDIPLTTETILSY